MSTSVERILFAGGGTGGHVFPIAHLIDAIQHDYPDGSYDLYRAGVTGSLEQREADRRDGVRFLSIVTGKRRRSRDWRTLLLNIRDLCKLSYGTIWSIYYLWRYRIDRIFCKGGYVALPLVLASFVTRTPLQLHESDTSLGLTNHIAARRATHVYTAFDHLEGEMVGQLLSDQMGVPSSLEDMETIIADSYDDTLTYLLVMGGSQGAQTLYDALDSALMQLSDVSSYHVIVIRGLLNSDYVFQSSDRVAMTVIDFADQRTLATLYQYADIAITRAGTTSLAEQKLRDMKLCMIPIPWTHDQLTNARHYVQEYGDDLIVQDADLVQNLADYLARHADYHKSLTDKDRSTLITLPKSIILHTLLASK